MDLRCYESVIRKVKESKRYKNFIKSHIGSMIQSNERQFENQIRSSIEPNENSQSISLGQADF